MNHQDTEVGVILYLNLFQIYHAGLYGSRYQWLYWSGRHGLLSQMEPGILGIVWEDDCTPDQIRLALEGTITFDPITTGNTEPYNTVGISGYVSNHLYAIHNEQSSQMVKSS